MSEINTVRTAVTCMAKNTAGQLHREDYYTMMLFAALWPELNTRLLGTTGIGLEDLTPDRIGNYAERLRQRYLPDTKNYFADLLITAPNYGAPLKSTLEIDEVLQQIPITHIYEFKFFASFPTLPRQVARKDTYKLKILGEYIRIACGQLPHMEQFVFMSHRNAKRQHSIESLLEWFQEDQFVADTSGVIVSVVDTNGMIHEAKE
ncbi:MAG TPA: hypothetical protein PKE26_16615 [Kiritimatiellia bacterium]|nr:hypothetical protein [Kiritimatiellia bacterium]HMP00720.1 hypothetical protein [Kiritimatiellia bacterium]